VADHISGNDMDALLHHLVQMTAHRDPALRDLAVVTAVHQLAGAVQTRVLGITAAGGQQFVQWRAIVRAGAAARTERPRGLSFGDPVGAYAALARCLAQRADSAEEEAADGTRTLWLPVWIGERADTCLEIVVPTPCAAATVARIGALVSIYRNFQSLIDYSERDSLTGLLNRKTFDDQLARMLQAASEQDPLPPGAQERRQQAGDAQQWLAVIDIDHFKLVNDRFGHVYGDDVLILVANLLQSSFRAYDRVFRFGGEEFVVLLRSTTLENARKVIDRFRTNVAGQHFPQVGKVTVSVGFVSISARDAPIVVLGHADQALYYAKSHGRNQACHYEQLVDDGMLATVASNDTAEFF
jgi:diguanylate cyclase (GGDEF)-like protein